MGAAWRGAVLAAVLAAAGVGSRGPGRDTPSAGTETPIPVAAATAATAGDSVRADPPTSRAAAGPTVTDDRSAVETFAASRDPSVLLAAARLADTCALRAETRAMLAVIARDRDAGPGCVDAADCAERLATYDQFARELARYGAGDPGCDALGETDPETLRAELLRRAAEDGDAEARVCYALAGPEIAPHVSSDAFGAWMAHWRGHALAFAWDAWLRGEPRAALALARLYAPPPEGRPAAEAVAPTDPRLELRFALLLTRALGLDPARHDLARAAQERAALLDPAERAAAESWVAAELPRWRGRRPPPARSPDACWQHFAVFAAR